MVTREVVERNGETLLSRPDDDDASDPDRLTQTAIEQVNVNKPFRELTEFFASIRYLHLVPQLVREPDRTVSRENDPFGSDFLEQLAQVSERTRVARFKQIAKALQVAVPQLEELEMVRDVRGVPHLRGRYRHGRPQGAWQGEGQFSDGTLRLLGLLWVMRDARGPLLLEEPELSLHPGVVSQLPQLLARVQRKTGRQVFLGTHSPDLLRDDGIGLDEVVLLVPGKEGTTVTVAGDFDDVRGLLDAGLSMAEAVVPRTYPSAGQRLSLFEG